VKPRRRLIPYVLLGVITLGTGLAVGLGLSEGPLTYSASPAPSHWTCKSSENQGVRTFNCVTAGERVSVWNYRVTGKGVTACLTKSLKFVPPPRSSESAFEKAVQAAESKCGFPPLQGVFKHFFENPPPHRH
jgi:hypothetical protein